MSPFWPVHIRNLRNDFRVATLGQTFAVKAWNTITLHQTARMYQLSSSTFVLLIVDVDEPSVRICATVNCGAYIRDPRAKTCLDKQKVLISCTVAHACFRCLNSI